MIQFMRPNRSSNRHRPILRSMQQRATNSAARSFQNAPRPQALYAGAPAGRSQQSGCTSCQKAKAAGLRLYKAHVVR